MDLGISGRTAAIAAGSAGLGLGAAKALAADGVRVAICGRDAAKLAAAAATIDGDVITLEADLSTPNSGREFVENATSALGHLDILVTNAGGPPPGPFADTDLDAYQTAFDMNCRSMIEMCRTAIPAMRERGWGRVCAITSVGVKQPIGYLMASSVARAGLPSFLTITAREVAADGVTVNSASGGDAVAAGFTVSTGNNTVLGFSLTGSMIAAGSGILTTLEVVGSGACLSDLILSDSYKIIYDKCMYYYKNLYKYRIKS